MRIAAWMLVAVVVVAARPASADCANGASEGYDQCQKYVDCRCSYEVKSCSNGGWYWNYFVTDPCPAASAKPTGPDAPPVKPPPDPECEAMQRWLAERHMLQQAYGDPDLVDLANTVGWSPNQYHMMVWRLTHPGIVPPGGVAVTSSMYTDWSDCSIKKIPQGCDQLKRRGLPADACTIAVSHEQTHVDQCKAGGKDPTSPKTASDNEGEAYQHEIDEIEKWLHDHCS